MLCSLHCLKAKLRLLGNKYQRHSSLNLVSQQLKLCNIFIFIMVYYSVTNSVQLLLFWSSFLLRNPLYGNSNVESTSPINFHFGFTYQSFQNLEQTLQRQQFIISWGFLSFDNSLEKVMHRYPVGNNWIGYLKVFYSGINPSSLGTAKDSFDAPPLMIHKRFNFVLRGRNRLCESTFSWNQASNFFKKLDFWLSVYLKCQKSWYLTRYSRLCRSSICS